MQMEYSTATPREYNDFFLSDHLLSGGHRLISAKRVLTICIADDMISIPLKIDVLFLGHAGQNVHKVPPFSLNSLTGTSRRRY